MFTLIMIQFYMCTRKNHGNLKKKKQIKPSKVGDDPAANQAGNIEETGAVDVDATKTD
jgi:hypothetical protein